MTIASLQHKPILASREGYVAYLLVNDGYTEKHGSIPPRLKIRLSKQSTYFYNDLASAMALNDTFGPTKEANSPDRKHSVTSSPSMATLSNPLDQTPHHKMAAANAPTEPSPT